MSSLPDGGQGVLALLGTQICLSVVLTSELRQFYRSDIQEGKQMKMVMLMLVALSCT